MTALLRVDGLQVTAGGRRIIDIAELTVDGGELAVITGGAGSGKTALAAALAGALESSGTVRVADREVQGPPSARMRAGLAVAVRDGARIVGCTVGEALHLPARRGDRPRQALEMFPQLRSRQRVLAQFLSGGEQQILQVACAWCAEPRVLVLDSPTVGLAADAAGVVVQLARDEAARGCAVLWLEQDPRAAPAPSRGTLVMGSVTATAAEPLHSPPAAE